MSTQVHKFKRSLLLIYSCINILFLWKLLKKIKKSKFRRWWVKPHLRPTIRDKYGGYSSLFLYFAIHDHEELINFIRMNLEDYAFLLSLVERRLLKRSRRKALSPSFRLAITLHYLGHGGCVENERWMFRIGKSTCYKIVVEVCKVLASVLIPLYVPFPDKQKWLQIAREFEREWHFPNCIGALDGMHVYIEKPAHSGAAFKNYKKFYSLVLMATCDARRAFTWFAFGDYGSQSDCSIFSSTDLARKLLNNDANIPPPRQLPDSNIRTTFVFVGDEIFGLQKHIMKPFSRRNNLSDEEKIFNYRLSRARWNIECTFGILCEKWEILQKTIGLKVENVDEIVTAAIGLHNFLIYNNDKKELEHIEENYVTEEERENQLTPTVIRNRFKDYFSSAEGSVPWQLHYIY